MAAATVTANRVMLAVQELDIELGIFTLPYRREYEGVAVEDKLSTPEGLRSILDDMSHMTRRSSASSASPGLQARPDGIRWEREKFD